MNCPIKNNKWFEKYVIFFEPKYILKAKSYNLDR